MFNNTLKNYDHLIHLLKSNDKKSQYFALINIERIENFEDADFLLSCLENQDSRIREFSSSLIKDHLMKSDTKYLFDNEKSLNVIVKSIKDINPKVCRNITCALQHLSNRLVIIEKIVKIIEQGNNFTLYWGLYALENLLDFNHNEKEIINSIVKLISKTSKSKEYQIRERSAFIVKVLNQSSFVKKYSDIKQILDELTNNLVDDQNFYVRNAVLSKD